MRKLATAAFCFSAAVFISHYLLDYSFFLIVGAVSFALSFTGLFFRGNVRLRIFIAAISLSVGFIWSFAYTAVFVKPHWVLHEETATVAAVVTDYPAARVPRGYCVDVSLRPEGLPAVGTRLYFNNESVLKPGDNIQATARLRRTDITDDGERYDVLSSRGIFLSGYVPGEIKAISHGRGGGGLGSGGDSNSGDNNDSNGDNNNHIRYIPKQTAYSIASIIDEIFPSDVSPFLKALLIGNRDDLYKDTALNAALSASGIIHIVAISGMHISFLMGFLGLIIKNKRLFAIYGIPILLIFMAMTGFTHSVTRAGIMQIFLICAPIFKRRSDNITSLLMAMLVLLAINPYACASVGLQMSFAATLGIILFTSRINYAVSDFLREKKLRRKSKLRTVINYVTSSFATTIGALVFTLPLMVIHFGYISLIAPITNLLTIGVVSVVFPIGLLAVALGFISPIIGTVAIVPVNWAVRYIMAVARLFARVPYAGVYSSSIYIMFWLAYVYVMFLTLPLLKARFRQYLYPVCIAVILLFAVILATLSFQGASGGADVGNNSVTVLDVGQGLSVVATVDSHTMVIDCGSSDKNNAGEITHEFLQSIGRTSIDLLAITHYHADHINGIEFLLSRINVSAIAIPDPDGSEGLHFAEDIIELARKRRVDIIYVTESLVVTVGETEVFIYPPLGSGGENERGLSFLIKSDFTALITGDMNRTTERALLRFTDLPKIDLLVVGHHGSRESTSEELLLAVSPSIAVISSGKNSFNHPHPETIQRFLHFGVSVYRTDEIGHVTVNNGLQK